MAYNKTPAIHVKNLEQECQSGWANLETLVCQAGNLVVMDLYPGASQESLYAHLQDQFDHIIDARQIYRSKAYLDVMLEHHLTDDRIFGTMFYGTLQDFADPQKLAKAQNALKRPGRILVLGPGAALITRNGRLFYVDMSRWEIQRRYRKGMPNFFLDNPGEDPLRKIKAGFFVEWRVFDKHKLELFKRVDTFIDLNQDEPNIASCKAIEAGLHQAISQPFRTVPYFDPGVWGGQWMKEVCDLDKRADNFAWSFDGVPEENALLLDFGSAQFQLPAMDLVLMEPQKLLGFKTFSRFGAEFPIRFDFLDTMGGQNLSLQVHPLTDYIHRTFGMAYTQDESYYLLDAKAGASVYLGLKENVDPQQIRQALEQANQGGPAFEASQFINCFPARKHDHFLIPAGTIHCAGKDAMVLEISATPYCFTFKLWDWGRLGLDGLPRPVHLDHGFKNIQWERTTPWVRANLVSPVVPVTRETEIKGVIEEKTGLHPLEFIETRRYWLEPGVWLPEHTQGTFSMLNLVEGEQILVCSPSGKWDPFEVHYAETFILPAALGPFELVNTGKTQAGIIRAFVRGTQMEN